MKRLVIARHGNTFAKGETPTRVGARTDLELVETTRAGCVGEYLKENGLKPDRVYAAPLKRTLHTAEYALKQAGFDLPVAIEEGLREIDYGADENKTEDAVVDRLGRLYLKKDGVENPTAEQIAQKGQEVIDAWNKNATLPDGWMADVNAMRAFWTDFASKIAENEIVFVVSSNGTIRFAPVITGDYDSFCAQNDIKVATGGVCVFENDGSGWKCAAWNVKPFKMYELS